MEIGNLEIKGNYSSTFCSVGTNIFFIFFSGRCIYIVVPTQRPRMLLTDNIQSGGNYYYFKRIQFTQWLTKDA